MKKITIIIIIILIIFGVFYITSYSFGSSINYAVKSTIWKIKNCELKDNKNLLSDATFLKNVPDIEEYEEILNRTGGEENEEFLKEIKELKSKKYEPYESTYKKYLIDKKCSNGKKPKIIYKSIRSPRTVDGGSTTYYYCKAEDETLIEQLGCGIGACYNLYLYQGNVCKT